MRKIHEIKKKSFEKISKLYDSIRPNYPEKIIKDIISISKIKPKDNILELGCGSGKATLFFAKKGFNITALDISKSLIKIAKKNLASFKNIQYIIKSFEKIELEKNHYKLIFSAQAFHWLDPDIRYKKSHRLLKTNGYLAIFANFQSHNTKMGNAVYQLYRKFCLNYPVGYGSLDEFKPGLKKSKLFKNIKEKTYQRTINYTKAEYINLQSTYSWVSTLDTKNKKLFFSALDNLLKDKTKISVLCNTYLLIAQKK